MARKKKQTKHKNHKDAQDSRSAFWPLSGAIIMLLVAMFLLFGMFGTGGPLPVNLYDMIYKYLGWATVLSPIALIYFGVNKFISEDKQIPLNKLISMVGVVIFSAAWLHIVFVDESIVSSGHGGSIGQVIGDASLELLSKGPAGTMFFVLAILAFFWSFA